MPDYIRIASKIRESIWLITPDGLSLILDIFDRRLSGERLTDEEIAIRLQDVGARDNEDGASNIQNGVGIIPLYGPIFGKANMLTQFSGATSMESFREDLASMVENPQVKSILLDIDSPGGTSDMIAEAGKEIFAARDEKPVYAIANNMSGSAAYWLMSQATKAYSSPSGSVGSIGAYTVHQDQSVADANAGRKFTFVSAGKYKTEGNPHEPLSQEGREYRQEVIDELYGEFVDAVASGRGVDAATVISDFGQGRMLLPKKALEVGMIDGIMEYNELMGQLFEQQPQAVRVVVPGYGGAVATAEFGVGGVYHINDTYNFESKEWEHSEPGTGAPPAPRKDEDGSDDKAITQRWRRDPLPLDQNDPNAPKPNARGGNKVTEEELVELRKVLELPDDATVEMITSTAKTAFTESKSLRDAVALSTEETRFATEFPTMYQEHMDLLGNNRKSAADNFSESVGRFSRPGDNGTFTPTDKGLSVLAKETISASHKKFAEGVGTLADFELVINTIVKGGVVDFSELGSGLPRDLVEIDTSTPGGISEARKTFAAKVLEVQTADNLDYNAAIKVAAEKYPDLAKAYRTPLPA